MSHLIFGAGYLGLRIACIWRDAGYSVTLVTRSDARAAKWRESGFGAKIADVTRPESLAGLPSVKVILWAVGLDRSAGRTMREVYVAGLRNALARIDCLALERFVAVSSTSVYGEEAGAVNEDSPCEPTRDNGRVCLEAERALRDSGAWAKSIILRLAGIYGPGRIPNVQALINGAPIAASPEHVLNLIHVDDATAAVIAAAHPDVASPDVFLVADGNPVSRSEFYAEAARLWGTPPPRFDSNSPVSQRSGGRNFAGDKRIDNAKLKRLLVPRLSHPTYREGLRAIRQSDPHVEL